MIKAPHHLIAAWRPYPAVVERARPEDPAHGEAVDRAADRHAQAAADRRGQRDEHEAGGDRDEERVDVQQATHARLADVDRPQSSHDAGGVAHVNRDYARTGPRRDALRARAATPRL